MRRRSNAAVINISLFIFALSVIIYANLPPSSKSNRIFDWRVVTYNSPTSEKHKPKPHGTCPGLATTTKPALVVARVAADGDTQWLDKLSDKYHICTYNVDAPFVASSNKLQVPANRGHEAMPYLTYIIDNYDDLPEASVFIHGRRFSWHNDDPEYDNLRLLRLLDTSSALVGPSKGYHNLRCDWSASTCTTDSKPQGSFETRMRGVLEPFNARVISDGLLPKVLQEIFSGAKLGRHDNLRAQCCAQFIVSRGSIRQHSRQEYAALRQWLLDDVAPASDQIAGRILSYMWHILFMPHEGIEASALGGHDLKRLNGLACPKASECYCRLYGLCEEQCSDGRCLGRYQVPAGFKLTKEWIAKHA